MTLIPVLSSFVLRGSAAQGPYSHARLHARLSPLLRFCLAHPLPVYVVAVAGAGAMVLGYLAIGKAFMPTMDEGSVIMQTTKLPSINLKESAATDLRIQRVLREKVPEVGARRGARGLRRVGARSYGPQRDRRLPRPEAQGPMARARQGWLVQQLRVAMAELPGVEFAFTQPIEMRTSEMLTGARGDLAVKIFGPDLKVLGDIAGRIQTAIAGVKGAAEVFTTSNDTVDYLQIDMDRLTAGRTGLSVTRVEDELRALLEGAPVGIVCGGARGEPIS